MADRDLHNKIPTLPPSSNGQLPGNIPVPGVHFGSVPGGGGGGGGDDEVREQDRYLPVANIARIMKRVLPPNEKIAKDAKESVQECVSEFIAFITSEASDRCQAERRKTINGEDILWAIGHLGFDDYNGPLKTYLQKYRQAAKGDKPDNSQSSSSSNSASAAANAAAADTSNFNTNNWGNNMQPVQVQSINSSVPSSSINNTTRSVPQQSSMQMSNTTMNGNFVPAQLATQAHAQRMLDEQQQK